MEDMYWSIWNQIYQLKEYCHMSLQELRLMTAEERAWYMNRHNEEIKRRNEQERRANNAARSSPSVRR